MSKFVWESEEDWEDPLPQEKGTRRLPWKKLLLWGTLLVVLISSTAGVLLWRVREANERVSEEVLSSHALLREAIAAGDEELFLGVLSGRFDGWTNTQISLFQAGQLLDVPPLGLSLAVAAAENERPEVTLEPDLLGAEVIVRQSYRDPFGSEFLLERTEIYRQGETRWLYAPPEDGYWGEWVAFTDHAGRIQARFPQRDAPYVWPILEYLEEKIAALCQLELYRCPPDHALEVVFHHDPYVLIQLQEPHDKLSLESPIILPTPSLLGRPVDDAGRTALRRIYAAQLLPRVIVERIGYECCQAAPRDALALALIDQQLARFGVLPDPLRNVDFDDIFGALYLPTSAALTGPLLAPAEVEERAALIAAFWVDYLLVGEEILLNELAAGRGIVDWGTGLSDDALLGEFSRFLREKLVVSPPPEAPTLPAAVALVCHTFGDAVYQLANYDLQREEWSFFDAMAGRIDPDLVASVGGRLLWVENQSVIKIWDGETVQILAEGEEGEIIGGIPFLWDQDTLFFFRMSQDGDSPNQGEVVRFGTYNAGSCEADLCEIRWDRHVRFWSPDGESGVTLSNDPSEGMWLENRAGERMRDVDGDTYVITWWDENAFLTIAGLGATDRDTEVFRQHVDGSPSVTLFGWKQLLLQLPGFLQGNTFPDLIQAVPDRRELVLATDLRDPETDIRYLALYNWETDEIVALHSYGNVEAQPLWSPDRRWLLMAPVMDRSSGMGNRGQGLLLDFETLLPLDIVPAKAQGIVPNITLPPYAWSADGRWLLQLNRGFMALILPSAEERWIVPYDPAIESCLGGGWIND